MTDRERQEEVVGEMSETVGRDPNYTPVQPTMSAATLTIEERDRMIESMRRSGTGIVDAGPNTDVRSRTVFTYDISSIPAQMTLDEVMRIYRETGMILHDSFNERSSRHTTAPVLSVVPLNTSIKRSKEER